MSEHEQKVIRVRLRDIPEMTGDLVGMKGDDLRPGELQAQVEWDVSRPGGCGAPDWVPFFAIEVIKT